MLWQHHGAGLQQMCLTGGCAESFSSLFGKALERITSHFLHLFRTLTRRGRGSLAFGPPLSLLEERPGRSSSARPAYHNGSFLSGH
jgi:hypothetical protein